MAQWNGHADLLAGMVNMNRAHHEHTEACLRLRQIFLGIAHSVSEASRTEPDDPVEDDVTLAGRAKEVDLVDRIPIGWKSLLGSCSGLPVGFIQDVCNFVFTHDADHGTVFDVSFLEMVFMMDSLVDFPVASPQNGTCVRGSIRIGTAHGS